MKKLIAVLALCGLCAAPALAGEELGQDLTLVTGYKLWVNDWQTTILPNSTQGGGHYDAITTGGIMSIPNVSLNYKNFLMTMAFSASGNYNYDPFTDVIGVPGVGGTAHLVTTDVSASRDEFDMNFGYYVVPHQLALTVGYKNITQNYTITKTSPGLVFAGNGETTHTYMNGVTFGITGAAPLPNGFFLYGTGVGGFMGVTYSPTTPASDSAMYASSELGVGWGTKVGFSATLGYKYQIVNTTTNSQNDNAVGVANELGNDVTQGYMLGINWAF